MDIKHYRIIAIGMQSPEMLSDVTQALSLNSYEIDSVSSLRLGHSFVIVLMVESAGNTRTIENCLKQVVDQYQLKLSIDECTRKKYTFKKSDAFMRIRGNQIAGIKPYIISELTLGGLEIHGLESDTYEKEGNNLFTINVKGHAREGIEKLTEISKKLLDQGIDVTVARDWKLLA